MKKMAGVKNNDEPRSFEDENETTMSKKLIEAIEEKLL